MKTWQWILKNVLKKLQVCKGALIVKLMMLWDCDCDTHSAVNQCICGTCGYSKIFMISSLWQNGTERIETFEGYLGLLGSVCFMLCSHTKILFFLCRLHWHRTGWWITSNCSWAVFIQIHEGCWLFITLILQCIIYFVRFYADRSTTSYLTIMRYVLHYESFAMWCIYYVRCLCW